MPCYFFRKKGGLCMREPYYTVEIFLINFVSLRREAQIPSPDSASLRLRDAR